MSKVSVCYLHFKFKPVQIFSVTCHYERVPVPTGHTRQHVKGTENRTRDSRARDSTLSPSETVSQYAKSTVVTPPPRVDLIVCGKEDEADIIHVSEDCTSIGT